jgi:hypothetical protein
VNHDGKLSVAGQQVVFGNTFRGYYRDRNFLPHHLLNGVSEYLFSGTIHKEDSTLGVNCSDGVQSRSRQSTEPSLPRAEDVLSQIDPIKAAGYESFSAAGC